MMRTRGSMILCLMLVLLASGCRLRPETEEPVQDTSTPFAGAALTLPAKLADPVVELRGFGVGGEASCLPLAPGRRCLGRADPVVEACVAAKGSVLRCEDCTALCSVPLP